MRFLKVLIFPLLVVLFSAILGLSLQVQGFLTSGQVILILLLVVVMASLVMIKGMTS